MKSQRISVTDLEHVLKHTDHLWGDVAGKTVLITGGTGFFGKWLLESFIYINNKLQLSAKLYVLSRDPDRFTNAYPQFNNEAISYIKGDVSSFEVPDAALDYIIHAATDANATLIATEPLAMYDTIVNGTRHILEIGKQKKVKAILHTSSGAVYGKQTVTHVDEDDKGCPDIFDKNAAYGEGKRAAEMLSSFYYCQYGVQSKIARCFAFVGPYLPLDEHFAIGNFIGDAINGRKINIKDGSPYRSYLYAADLVIWLWTILIKGEPCRVYNVGSDEDITISDLAKMIALLAGDSMANLPVSTAANSNPARYVPSVNRAKNELNLEVYIPLKDALQRTLDYNSHKVN